MDKKFNSTIFSSDYNPEKQENTRIAISIKLLGKGKKILDVGCRDGLISKRIADAGNTVEGIDISDYAILKTREKGIVVYDYDLNKNWAGDLKKKYDAVFCGEVLEHIWETDLFLKNIHQCLKSNGTLVLSTPNLASLGRRILLLLGRSPTMELTTRATDAGHLRYYVYTTLKKVLEENGFMIELFTSDVVNFSFSGKVICIWLAKMFPKFGRSLIVLARKTS